MCDIGDRFDIEGEQVRVAERFGIDRFGLAGNRGFDRLRIRLGELDVDAKSRQRVVEEVEGPPIQAGGGNDLSPALARFWIAAVSLAACPDANATAAAPPSSAAMRFSKTSVVGFMMRV